MRSLSGASCRLVMSMPLRSDISLMTWAYDFIRPLRGASSSIEGHTFLLIDSRNKLRSVLFDCAVWNSSHVGTEKSCAESPSREICRSLRDKNVVTTVPGQNVAGNRDNLRTVRVEVALLELWVVFGVRVWNVRIPIFAVALLELDKRGAYKNGILVNIVALRVRQFSRCLSAKWNAADRVGFDRCIVSLTWHCRCCHKAL